MDRSTVIGLVLITLIMMVWLYYLTPPPPPPRPSRVDQDTVATQEPARTGSPAEVPMEADSLDLFGAALRGQERRLVVETELYTAELSNRGATIRQLTLKRYRSWDGRPVRLIADSARGALELGWLTKTNRNVETRRLIFSLLEPNGSDTLRLRASDTLRLPFVLALDSLRRLQLEYTFTGASYEIGLRLKAEGLQEVIAGRQLDVIWDSGLPFAEKDRKTEALEMGAFAYSGRVLEAVRLDKEPTERKTLSGKVDWVAVRNHYFTAILMPTEPTEGAELVGLRRGSGPEDSAYVEHYRARLIVPFDPEASSWEKHFRLYLGPMEYYRLAAYKKDLYRMVNLGPGWLDWIVRPLTQYVFIPVFTFLGRFIPNYGLVIVLFSLLVKLVLHPLTARSYESMAKMRALQPELEAIRAKYPDNPQKQQEAMLKLYRELRINPLGGCLPMLLQLPILIALWRFFPSVIEIRQKGFLWCKDLSAPDSILDLPFTIPLYGDHVSGFTLLMALTMILQTRMSSPGSSQAQMAFLNYLFPILLFLFFNNVAAGLSLYYLVFNLLTILQLKFFVRTEIDHATLMAELQGKKSRQARAPKPKRPIRR
ncbi:MAG: membrane protein insertase YidC [Bacteroidetes bacterium]|nr:membrane protein insertase YidC [Rhodothermia bacterium]MCS7155807.1 membrane protein insertase YidC [Bacteroidota bacterium]MCX7906092.1 membrane protein insertase YidC [Bacteroidota bacterium]MDW8138220.1 membrane protein insertase YidC [Bacteroidota bacterium]MDW8285904.1 membrane protein insertase YidC [Bacteroidota bacterium]